MFFAALCKQFEFDRSSIWPWQAYYNKTTITTFKGFKVQDTNTYAYYDETRIITFKKFLTKVTVSTNAVTFQLLGYLFFPRPQ